MPHHVTNRKRHYDSHPRSSARQRFVKEAANASAYLLGGLAFTLGSFFFLPVLESFYSVGVWLFVIGSALYLAVTLHDLTEVSTYLRSEEASTRAGRLEMLNVVLYLLGSVLFLGGSALFLPALKAEAIGAWCFIVGSLVFVGGAAINVRLITEAGSMMTLQMFNAISILFILGSALFVVGSVPYLWEGVASPDGQPLHTYLAGQFIAGSFAFLAGGVVNFYRAWIVYQHHQRS